MRVDVAFERQEAVREAGIRPVAMRSHMHRAGQRQKPERLRARDLKGQVERLAAIRKLSGTGQRCRQYRKRKSVGGFKVFERRSARREGSEAARIVYREQESRLVKMQVQRGLTARETHDLAVEVEFTHGMYPGDIDRNLIHAEAASLLLDFELYHQVQAIRQHVPVARARVLALDRDRDSDDGTRKPLAVAPAAGHRLDRGVALANAFGDQTGEERERDEQRERNGGENRGFERSRVSG